MMDSKCVLSGFQVRKPADLLFNILEVLCTTVDLAVGPDLEVPGLPYSM